MTVACLPLCVSAGMSQSPYLMVFLVCHLQWIKDRLRVYEDRHRDWSGEHGA